MKTNEFIKKVKELGYEIKYGANKAIKCFI